MFDIQGPIRLTESFTIDLWPWEGPEYDPKARLYRLALCATGTQWVTKAWAPIGYSDALVSGVVAFYPDDGEGFAILPESLKYPKKMSRRDAVLILKAIFEDSGRGAAVTEDWVWRPVDLSQFLQPLFSPEHAHSVVALLRKQIHRRNRRQHKKRK